ncbi:2-oxoacid:acceptor oxidoreductase family protein [Thermovirga sp.]|uniref:2-oxoacid:acceptor oxidoreductase family protein n=1 Tax=Thermovirga sp. TaxID=2699834 RepID=UPI0025D47D3C|nr:2-oxoacid:acceptor oxidoreductase family protein [Thermovirga sp.]MBO8153082.1 2-oxoacid:acceptor oxidoreductase family protein [Thermovirga sp.]
MSSRYEIRFAGSGGQGVILAAVVTGEAAALYEELNSVQSQAYGPEARGGKSKSEVVISKDEIDYPKAMEPDLQIILNQASCDEFAVDTKKGGVVILDDTYVKEAPEIDAEVYMVPIVKTAREKIGRELVTNMVALGAMAKILERKGIIKPENIKKAILARVPKGTEELNAKAFDEGYALIN